jgi:hypothetical protein
MKTLKTLTIILMTLTFLVTSGGLAMSEDKYSGFLEDYPTFEPDKDRKGAKIYHKPGVMLKKYTKILIVPIEIWLSPKSKYKGMKPDDLKKLADAFRTAIVNELEPDFPVVSKPGPDVLALRIAITDVNVKKKKRGLLGYTPIGFVAGGVKNLAVGPSVQLVDEVIEVEMLDSQTTERLGALIDRHSASKEKKKKTSWEEIQKTLTFYAKRFRGRMDAEHGK